MTLLIEIHYLPCIAYFAALQPYSEVIIEKYEHYVKQSYRNRCYINTEHGKHCLIVPLTEKHGKVPISDVRIDYNQKWLSNHWRTIISAYSKAPFFEHYAPDLEKVLFRKFSFLYDLNINLLSLCLRWLRWNVSIKESLSYNKIVSEGIDDLRDVLNLKKTAYEEKFYTPYPYQQVFGNAFVKNLSLIDLIFCNGPEAGRIVSLSSKLNKY